MVSSATRALLYGRYNGKILGAKFAKTGSIVFLHASVVANTLGEVTSNRAIGDAKTIDYYQSMVLVSQIWKNVELDWRLDRTISRRLHRFEIVH